MEQTTMNPIDDSDPNWWENFVEEFSHAWANFRWAFFWLCAIVLLLAGLDAATARPHAQHCLYAKDPCMVIDCLQQERLRNTRKIA
jgi:hypothetical protein